MIDAFTTLLSRRISVPRGVGTGALGDRTNAGGALGAALHLLHAIEIPMPRRRGRRHTRRFPICSSDSDRPPSSASKR